MRNSHKVKERDHKALERRRMAAGTLFDKGVSQYKVAQRFRVSTAATNQWHTAWKARGEDGLTSKGGPGFASVYTPEKKRCLKSEWEVNGDSHDILVEYVVRENVEYVE